MSRRYPKGFNHLFTTPSISLHPAALALGTPRGPRARQSIARSAYYPAGRHTSWVPTSGQNDPRLNTNTKERETAGVGGLGSEKDGRMPASYLWVKAEWCGCGTLRLKNWGGGRSCAGSGRIGVTHSRKHPFN